MSILKLFLRKEKIKKQKVKFGKKLDLYTMKQTNFLATSTFPEININKDWICNVPPEEANIFRKLKCFISQNKLNRATTALPQHVLYCYNYVFKRKDSQV